MAITATALSADLSINSLTMTVASGSGFPTAGASTPASNYLVRIDKEFMLAILQPVANVIKLAQRGYNGTIAAPHDVLAQVEVGQPSDYAQNPAGTTVTLPPYLPDQKTIGENITFSSAQVAAWGNQPQQFAITKASAAAIVLVAPSKAQDGLEVTFTSLSDAIHAITATALLATAGASSPYTTATWANAKAGGGIVLVAENGLWNVITTTNVTIT